MNVGVLNPLPEHFLRTRERVNSPESPSRFPACQFKHLRCGSSLLEGCEPALSADHRPPDQSRSRYLQAASNFDLFIKFRPHLTCAWYHYNPNVISRASWEYLYSWNSLLFPDTQNLVLHNNNFGLFVFPTCTKWMELIWMSVGK